MAGTFSHHSMGKDFHHFGGFKNFNFPSVYRLFFPSDIEQNNTEHVFTQSFYGGSFDSYFDGCGLMWI